MSDTPTAINISLKTTDIAMLFFLNRDLGFFEAQHQMAAQTLKETLEQTYPVYMNLIKKRGYTGQTTELAGSLLKVCHQLSAYLTQPAKAQLQKMVAS